MVAHSCFHFLCISPLRLSRAEGLHGWTLVWLPTGRNALLSRRGSPWRSARYPISLCSPGLSPIAFAKQNAELIIGFPEEQGWNPTACLVWTVTSSNSMSGTAYHHYSQGYLWPSHPWVVRSLRVSGPAKQISSIKLVDQLYWETVIRTIQKCPKNNPDCLILEILPYQQIPGCLKSHMHTRACNHEASSTCLQSTSTIAFSWSNGW